MACISHDWNSLSHGKYLLWLVISWELVHWHVVLYFTLCMIWKVHIWMCVLVKFWNLGFMSLNWAIIMGSTKIICFAKSEGTVDHSRVTRWFKKFCTGCKNFDDWTRSRRHKMVDSEAKLQAIEHWENIR